MGQVFRVSGLKSVQVDAHGMGEVKFEVTNATSQAVRGRARLAPGNSPVLPWLKIAGEEERDFNSNGTEDYVVKIAVPAGTPAGQYTFRLDVVDVRNTDEDKTEGPTVAISVTLAPPPPKKNWWIYVVIAVAVLAIGLAIVHFLPGTPPVDLASLACAPPSLGSHAVSVCTLDLTTPAPVNGSTVTVASDNASLTVPATVTVDAGDAETTFNATAGELASSQNANVTAKLISSKTAAISLVMAPPSPVPTVSGVACNPTNILQHTTSACAVTLTQGATFPGVNVIVTSNNPLLSVQGAVFIPVGAVSFPFIATAAATVPSTETVTITAVLNGGSQSVNVQIAPIFIRIPHTGRPVHTEQLKQIVK